MLTCDVTWWAVDTLYTVTVPTTYTVSVPDPVVTYYVTPVEVRQTARWPDEKLLTLNRPLALTKP